MPLLIDGLCEEVAARIERARQEMRRSGYSALIVYGNTKINGSLRYLSGYWPDRGGWLASGPRRSDIKIFDAATLVVPLSGEPVLVLDKGQLLDREACTKNATMSGFGELSGLPSEARTIARVLVDSGDTDRVGIETWDKFPAPLYLELRDALPRTEFIPSTVVEELTIAKSSWEINIFRQAGAIGDLGHQAFLDALHKGSGQTELELIRAAEAVMRDADPIYEECSPISPSLISSGAIGRLSLLHTPQITKRVNTGDAINWDIGMRYCGYPVDTSRTRVLGKPTLKQSLAYDAVLEMRSDVLGLVRPGIEVQDLVEHAERVARARGFALWDRFLGHGLGLDVHSRPDMGQEEMTLEENMMITIEPRIVLDGSWLLGNEDMILVTAEGFEAFTTFPLEPLGLKL